MKVKFVQTCTVYPDGKLPQRYDVNAVAEFSEEYGQLLIEKGHAVANDPALAEALKKSAPQGSQEPIATEDRHS